MKQEQIDYDDIISLGFNEEFLPDTVYRNKNGYEYYLITKDLTKKIYLDWEKETKLCKMVRIDNPNECNIQSEMPMYNLKQIKTFIDFYCNEKE